MRTESQSESRTIILEGDVEHPSDADLERIAALENELASRHEGGKIIYQTSKRSGYTQLTVQWRSKPTLVGD